MNSPPSEKSALPSGEATPIHSVTMSEMWDRLGLLPQPPPSLPLLSVNSTFKLAHQPCSPTSPRGCAPGHILILQVPSSQAQTCNLFYTFSMLEQGNQEAFLNCQSDLVPPPLNTTQGLPTALRRKSGLLNIVSGSFVIRSLLPRQPHLCLAL